jgi:hypothetical protein
VVVAGADSGFRYVVEMVSDGRGGAIVAWKVVASESTGVDSLVVQRIDSLGNLCWGNLGLVLATDSVATWPPPYMCTDRFGGACIAWDFSKSYRRAFVQHIDSAGCVTWPGAGVLLFTSDLNPIDIMPLSSGYMIAGARADGIRAQRINDQGQLLWGPDGSSVFHGASDGVGLVRILSGPDSSGFVIWSEARADTTNVFAQFMRGMGERQWDSLGVKVSAANDRGSGVFGCVAVEDGFTVSWPYNGGSTDWDIYVQHVDTAGRLLWGDPGLGIATDSGRQGWEPSVITDARHGAIITWGYSYFGGHVGLSVQRAGDVAGVAGPMLTSVVQTAIQARPSPARSAVEIILTRQSACVVVADALGRVVRLLPVAEGNLTATWDLRDLNGSRVPAGVYVFRQRGSGTSLGRVVVVNP